jgi:DNA polymerase III epsilon subunit family exonuclease
MEFDPLPQQRVAVAAPLGPILVVAGPGAGKTFCLISRVSHLITALGFQPARICAVTFTNKAAEEIAQRLERTLGQRAEEITRGTLHALCLGILREHAEAAGLRRGFGVADEQYQRAILGRLRVHPRRRGTLLGRFGRRRLQGAALSAADERDYREYLACLARRGMLDFDGLLLRAAALLRDRPDIADALAARWDYLLVDEFQDLNPPQYDILTRLAQPHRNMFAVGDDEQSIFSWTGADPLVLQRFCQDHGIARPIVLDRNCRCSRQIFETARRVLAENPQLFDKTLTADRTSEHGVTAYGFGDEAAEAAWLLDDLQADRAATGHAWGDYAVLYRRHQVGDYLEGQMLRAGIPCRLARGRSIAEDKVVGFVIAALRVMRDPSDTLAIEAFAECMLPEHLLEEVRAFGESAHLDFPASVRALARARPRSDPNTKRLWSFVYRTENLAALPHHHDSLIALVEQLLSLGTGPHRNGLEERHDELSDPADVPEAVRLADRIERVIATKGQVAIEPMGGLEIALRGMLVAAGLRRLPSAGAGVARANDLLLCAADGGDAGLAVVLFKALQLVHAREIERSVRRFVAFDLETTDKDPASCDIIEIGAAKVVDGEIVARFHRLVRPARPITAGATKIHGRTNADVADQPALADIWPEFRAFVGQDLLVAHNGQAFDVPVLRRRAAGQTGADALVFYDTLPLARSLSPDSAKLGDLATRFGIDAGRSHHALDDAVTLAQVFGELERQRVIRARKAVLVNALDFLGLALALEETDRPGDERRVLFELSRFHTLGRFSDSLQIYGLERERSGVVSPPPDDVIDRLGGHALMARLRAEPDPAQRYPSAVARLHALLTDDAGLTLAQAMDRLLERVALSTSDGVEVSPDRVSLLTLHATKGLEFSRVYVVGVEDFQLPGFRATVELEEDDIAEARRLLYVGMTRAQDRLILTRVDRRFGRDSGGGRFLDEMDLHPEALARAGS